MPDTREGCIITFVDISMDRIATISVTGADALTFLQGQLSNDLRRLETEDALLAAWCNPKGRVIALLRVTATEGGYALALPAELADGVARRLAMFRFRAKADIEILPGETDWPASEALARGEPFIGLEQTEKFTPHMLNLDLLDAISFDKGCYTGQEVVARTHYKGATKRRTLRFACDGPAAVGDKVSLQGRDVGEVLNVADDELLAVVPTDKGDAGLQVGAASLTQKALPYTVS